jgi:hypothetical protein
METLLWNNFSNMVGPDDHDYLKYTSLYKLSLMKVEASDQRRIIPVQINEKKHT